MRNVRPSASPNSATKGGRRTIGLCAALAIAALLVSCKSPLTKRVEPLRFTDHEQAGTGHVAVLSVGEWDRYVDDMKTAFTISPAEAVAQAGATTALMENKLLDTLKVVVRAATPSSDLALTKREVSGPVDEDGNTLGADGEPIAPGKYRDAVETEKAGTLPDAPTSLAAGKAAKDLPGIEAFGLDRPKQLGSAALTQYQLASALTQEVHLLNRYVSDAAVRTGYGAYIVRLQVSLMPRVRNAPYDAYTTLSFFPSDSTVERLACTTPRGGDSRSLPVVVPLLVTDDMEAALASNSSDTIRQYALALSALVRGFSASADVERYTDELIATVTRDYNSLYSVARLTDNTIRVRMGARLHSTRQYFMVPQTHNVTLLVLTPGSWPNAADVQLEGRTEFTDVDTGVNLSGRRYSRQDEIYDDILRVNFELKPRSGDVSALKHATNVNDFPTFRERVLDMVEAGRRGRGNDGEPDEVVRSADARTARRLWTAFTQVTTGSQYTSTAFSLPEKCCCHLPGADGIATAVDDAADAFKVELRPVRNVNVNRLGVRLRLRRAGKDFYVAASDVKFDRDHEVLRCQFPSLARVKVGGALATAGAACGEFLEIRDRASACSTCATGGPVEYCISVATVLKAPPSEAKAVELKAPKALRICKCGPGEITVALERSDAPEGGAITPAEVTLSYEFTDAAGKVPASGVIADATVLDPKGVKVVIDQAINETTFLLAKEARVRLKFDELANGSKLTIVVRSKKPKTQFDKAEVLVFVSDAKAPCGCPKETTPDPAAPKPAAEAAPMPTAGGPAQGTPEGPKPAAGVPATPATGGNTAPRKPEEPTPAK